MHLRVHLLHAFLGGTVKHGDTIYLKACNNKHLHVKYEDGSVGAVWNDQGRWQGFTIEGKDGTEDLPGFYFCYLKSSQYSTCIVRRNCEIWGHHLPQSLQQ